MGLVLEHAALQVRKKPKQMSKYISLQIMLIGHTIVLCKEPCGNKSSLTNNLLLNQNLCENE